MHIPDGIVDNTATLAGTWIGAAGAVGYAARWVRLRLPERRVVLMAVMSALIFALQMLNFPVAAGTSGHFAGGAAVAILLGPWPAVVVMTTVLLVQAVVFVDGGLVALGPNIFNLAVVTTFTGWWAYSAISRIARGRRDGRPNVVAAFAAGWVSIVCGATAAAIEIAASGKIPLALALGSMAFWHAVIGIGEGLITAGLLGYLAAVRPEILDRSETDVPVGRTVRLLALLAMIAAALSVIASAFPDGLERVLANAGVDIPASRIRVPFALADYALPGLTSHPALSTAFSGLVGALLVGLAAWAFVGAARARKGTTARPVAPSASADGFHRHPHTHETQPAHVHPHHHHAESADSRVSGGSAGSTTGDGDRPAHQHAHGPFFERYTYIVSPVHALDPRAKVLAGTALVFAIVLSPPLGAAQLVTVLAIFAAVALAARLPLSPMLARSAVVLPFAGAIALFAPLAASGGSLNFGGIAGSYAHGGWIAAYAVLSKAWLSACVVLLIAATTPAPRLFKGLRALHAPTVVITMLAFLYRYTSAMREQLTSLRHALESRGFAMSRLARVRLYGHLAGNLFVRAVERGERVHAAMVSRGFDGTIPSADELTLRPADVLAGVVVIIVALWLVVV